MSSEDDIADLNNAVLTVAGRTTLTAGEGLSEIVLDNAENRFGSIDFSGSQIQLNEAEDTLVERVIADNFTANSTDITVGDGATMIVDDTVALTGENVAIGPDGDLQLGAVEIVAGTNATVRSSILPRIVDGAPTNVQGGIVINSPLVVLGIDNGEVSLVTEGGTVSINGLNATGNTVGAEFGAIELLGTVNIDTTNRSESAGAGISLVRDQAGTGTIDASAAATSDVVLSLTAGSGDVALGDIGSTNPLNTLTITSAGDVNFANTVASGDTIDVSATGNVVADGIMRELLGSITVITEGLVQLGDSAMADQGSVTLISGADAISTREVSAGDSISLTAATDLVVSGNVAGQSGQVSLVSEGGSLSAGGQIESGGDLAVSAVQDIELADAVSAGGAATFSSSAGSIDAFGALSSQGDLSVSADQSILLGSNTTSNGSVSVASANSTILSEGTIDAADEVDLAAQETITLNSTNGTGLRSGAPDGETNIVSASGDLLFNSDVEVAGDVNAYSIESQIRQARNTTISAGGSATVSAKTGMEVATIDAVGDVTLILTRKEVGPDGEKPLFKRVNDKPDDGDLNPDVRSDTGAIVYLSPLADVGTTDDPFVQRAESPDGGIFYGLERGEAFSIDIGTSRVLTNSPDDFDVGILVSSDLLDLGVANLAFDPDFDLNFQQSLVASSNSQGKVGRTSAAASSRSTAASQREEEEEVAEVDETAFQNLKNYDENPQGVRLPADQRFAFDEDGNIYFIVTIPTRLLQPADSFTLYRVDLDLNYHPNLFADGQQADQDEEIRPDMIKLSMTERAGGGAE